MIGYRLLASAVVSGGVAWAVGEVVRRHAEDWGLLDRPGPRSSHQRATPRGGGIGVFAGLMAGLGALALLGSPLGRGAWVLVLGGTALAALGAWDDIRSIPAWPRVSFHVAVAAVVVGVLGGLDRVPLPEPLGISLGGFGSLAAVVWIVGVANFFNFMDGIDGLAGGQAVATGVAIAATAWSADAAGVGALIAGSVAGFLILNWPPARLFLGDSGSVPLGFLLAASALLAPPERRADAVLTTALSLALFLLDPVVTLYRRWRRGAKLTKSHREHSYQRLVRPGATHRRTAAALVAAALLLSALGALAFDRPAWRWPAVLVALGVYAVEAVAARRNEIAPPDGATGEPD